MKISIFALVIAVLGARTPATFAADNPDLAASQVLALERKWNDAYKSSDIAKMDDLLADDFIITIEDGRTFSKAGYIALNGNKTMLVEVSEMSDLKIRIHGSTAVITGAYHEKGTESLKSYEYHDRLTDVWMKTQTGWKLLASHYSLNRQ